MVKSLLYLLLSGNVDWNVHMYNVACYVLFKLMSLSQNEFYGETAPFMNATDLALLL